MTEDAFRRMLRDMEETMERFHAVGSSPMQEPVPVDVEVDGDHLVVRADLPGVEKEQIQVSVGQDTLDIAARDAREITEENEKYLRQERSQRRFQRSLALPVPVDPDSAEAMYENGVLTVRIRKEGQDARRNVDVT